MSTDDCTTGIFTLSTIYETTKMYEDILRCVNCKKQTEELIQICDSTESKNVDKMDQRFIYGCICCLDCYTDNNGFKGHMDKKTLKHPCTLCEKTCYMLFDFHNRTQEVPFTASQKRKLISARNHTSLGNPKCVENMHAMIAANNFAKQKIEDVKSEFSKIESENSTLKRKLEHTKQQNEKARRSKTEEEPESALPDLETSMMANKLSEVINDLAQMESDKCAVEEDEQGSLSVDEIENILLCDDAEEQQVVQHTADGEDKDDDLPLSRRMETIQKEVEASVSSSSMAPTPSTTITTTTSIDDQILDMGPLTASRARPSPASVQQAEEQAPVAASPSVSETISTKKKRGRPPAAPVPHYQSKMKDSVNNVVTQQSLNRWMAVEGNTEEAFWEKLNKQAREGRQRRKEKAEEKNQLIELREELHALQEHHSQKREKMKEKMRNMANAVASVKLDIHKIADKVLQGHFKDHPIDTMDDFISMFPSFGLALKED